ncbi:MAG: hypothetical protein Q8M91_18035 [Polaromonas sp.]|nr:hypothetical protein [Polaromonas sp.]
MATLASLGQAQAPRRAVQQRQTQRLLELAQVLAERRRGDRELACRRLRAGSVRWRYPVSKIIALSGLAPLVLTSFGAFALNFSAITAAIQGSGGP